MHNTGDAFDDASRDPRDKISPLRHDMDFSGSRPPSMSPFNEDVQDPVDKSLPPAQEPILLTQHRGPRVPPSASNSMWSRYTTSDTARTAADANPIHSQGPSHLQGGSATTRMLTTALDPTLPLPPLPMTPAALPHCCTARSCS